MGGTAVGLLSMSRTLACIAFSSLPSRASVHA